MGASNPTKGEVINENDKSVAKTRGTKKGPKQSKQFLTNREKQIIVKKERWRERGGQSQGKITGSAKQKETGVKKRTKLSHGPQFLDSFAMH